MKIFKVIGIVVLVLVVLFFGIASFLPSEVQVERSLVIPASSTIVFNEINNLKQWEQWSPWHQSDPNMVVTYDNAYEGEGASYSWESEKMGRGKLTITESRPSQYIATEMDFMDQGTASSYYRFETVKDGTKVTWGFETDMGDGPTAKYMGLLMDNMVGSDFEKGLQNLKAHVRKLPVDAMTQETSLEGN